MIKICGFIQPRALAPEDVVSRLHRMVQVQWRAVHTSATFLVFERGGIALLHTAHERERNYLWDGEYQGRCGVVVGRAWNGGMALDTPALLERLDTDGVQGLAGLNGDFVVVSVELQTGELLLASSRYGFVPLYYSADQEGCLFASEVKALVPMMSQRALDWEGVADFFYAGHLLGDRTLLIGVQALEGGQAIRYHQEGVQCTSYTDATQVAVRAAAHVSSATVADLFVESVARRLDHSATNTVLLSGGLDSRLILGTLCRLGVRPRIIALEHDNERSGADGRYAQAIAAQLGLECELRRTEPEFYASAACLEVFSILDGMAPSWDLFISQVYAQLDPQLGSVWEGMGLGSALGGAHQHSGGLQANLAEFLEKRQLHRRLLAQILTPEAFAALDTSFGARLRAAIERIPASPNRYGHFLMRQRIRRRIAPNPYQLFAGAVQPLTPGTDVAFLDYVLSIPVEQRLHHRLYTELIREHFPELATVPVISGGAPLPLQGQPHSRVQTWGGQMRGTFKRTAERYISRRELRHLLKQTLTKEERGLYSTVIDLFQERDFERPFYRKTALRRMFAAYAAGDLRYHELFRVVCYLELWQRLLIDPNPLRMHSQLRGYEAIEIVLADTRSDEGAMRLSESIF